MSARAVNKEVYVKPFLKGKYIDAIKCKHENTVMKKRGLSNENEIECCEEETDFPVDAKRFKTSSAGNAIPECDAIKTDADLCEQNYHKPAVSNKIGVSLNIGANEGEAVKLTTNPDSTNTIIAKSDKVVFQYGNYNQYYGYRNPGSITDNRIQYFKSEWFDGKYVLDIGCNIGHITATIATKFKPTKIIGLDIDKKLIDIAKKNVRYYVNSPGSHTKLKYGRKPGSEPVNLEFVAANYVLDCDELLETVVPEYDTILCLSTTKWIHLNFGDEGIKRTFRRIYAQLKPGGIFILEAQDFNSYRKKKKVTETIFKNFKNISFKPEHFSDFLKSELHFLESVPVELTNHSSRGFQRLIQVYQKPP